MAATSKTLVLFRVGNRACALPDAAVRDILPLPMLWRPPGLPPVVAGFANLGGDAVSILDLAQLFEIERREPADDLYQHLLRLRGASSIALQVDRVEDVVAVPTERITPVADRESLHGCVEAEVEIDGAFVHLLSPQRLLAAREAEILALLRSAAAARLAAWETALVQ